MPDVQQMREHIYCLTDEIIELEERIRNAAPVETHHDALRKAYADGRITLSEFEQLVGWVLRWENDDG